MRPSDLETFLAVAKAGSFRGAAQDRGVTGSALSQSVRALEEALEVRLFNRTTRSVALTEAGELLYERLAPAFDDIWTAVDEVRSLGRRPQGRVRINAPAPAVEWLIAPHVPAFLDAYPGISLEVIADAGHVDIVAEGYDAGVRMGLEMARDMIAVPLGPEQDYPVMAAPDYIERAGRPERPEDLSRHNCIRHRFPGGTIFGWSLSKGEEEITLAPEGTLTVNDSRHAVHAAVHGVGVVSVAAPYAAGELAAGRLLRLLPDWSTARPAWHLYYPGRRQVPPALRAFLQFFRAAARQPPSQSPGGEGM
ncbi:LysR family transcriptional regulator [Celeribacter indicus]|uniref:LysR family transcriptional regulator n=1 Tax=Celeribacter indicus TaxID=1208324 RepID=A0A0B5DS07_9RHOB|nr:LysR family transcriptional regulator [Celeribacter indicus]AJE45824.1 LysR family transcriptional regulator [Celeribacter indicus]SDW61542.1 transcriptional regulator, LysR family [Celeribacter indicus]